MPAYPAPRVALVIGSASRSSLNRQFAQALAKLGRPKLDMRLVEVGHLPLYNYDLDSDPPADVVRFKQDIEASDAVVFVTPEYLRSAPAVLKNALEWGARPYGKNSFAGKPGAIVGASIGAIGTAAAQSQLRSILPVLEIALLAQPEIYLNLKSGMIDEKGDIADEGLRKLLQSWIDRFASWIAQQKQPLFGLAS